MRIRMTKLAAGPRGVWPIGAEVVVDDDVGRAMCESGAAVPVVEKWEAAVVVPDEVRDGVEVDEDQRPKRRARNPRRGKKPSAG